MSELRKEVLECIDRIPDSTLEALWPILHLLTNDDAPTEIMRYSCRRTPPLCCSSGRRRAFFVIFVHFPPNRCTSSPNGL